MTSGSDLESVSSGATELYNHSPLQVSSAIISNVEKRLLMSVQNFDVSHGHILSFALIIESLAMPVHHQSRRISGEGWGPTR